MSWYLPASVSVFPWLCCCLVVGDAGLWGGAKAQELSCGEEQKPRLGLSQLPHLKMTVWPQGVSGR